MVKLPKYAEIKLCSPGHSRPGILVQGYKTVPTSLATVAQKVSEYAKEVMQAQQRLIKQKIWYSD